MSVRSIVVVALAIVCGGTAATGVLIHQSPAAAPAAPEAARVKLLVADVAIGKGQMLSAGLVREQPWPSDCVPEGAITDVAQVEQRSALASLVAGELILDGKLGSLEGGGSLAELIPKGKRAFSIQTSGAATNVAGFVRPGNRVDVLLNLRSNPQDDSGGGLTITLLQAVEVLAVGRLVQDVPGEEVDAKELSSVTVIVSPEEANVLDLGQSIGALTLALRNPEDTAQEGILTKTLDDIRYPEGRPVSIVEPAASEAVEPIESDESTRPTTAVIRTLRGGHWGQIEVSPNRS